MSSSSVTLKDLFNLAGLPVSDIPAADIQISAVTDDSRRVESGTLFVATRGTVADGHRFIADALAHGAAAVVAESGGEVPSSSDPSGAPVITVADSRDALGHLVHAFHGNPTGEMLVIGVSGTNGKTTSAYMVESILQAAGRSPAVVGTIEYRYAGRAVPAPNTTPSAVQLAEMFAEMRRAGVDAAAVELSSHAADQRRISGMEIDVAILTNITQDHLDYHGTMEAYAAAKRSIYYDYLLRPKRGAGKPEPAAVFNIDDPHGAEFAAGYPGRKVTVAIDSPDADLRATNIRPSSHGTSFTVEGASHTFDVEMTLLGPFNVMNALGVIGACLAAGIPERAIVDGLGSLRSNFGRFEHVAAGQDFTVIVDYAHTPDALENVLRNGRKMTDGRLICVFGCGGDRDNKKRPMMGKIAGDLSDYVIVTNDNPRTEDPLRITDMVMEGVRSSKISPDSVETIHDRRDAIGRAVSVAASGDLILIAGKGHEDYQIVGTEKHHFDDRETARELLNQLLPGGAGVPPAKA